MALGEGMIDWRQVLGHLRLRGWDDWLSNENVLLIPPERRPGLGTVYEGMPSWLADVDRPLVERLRADRELIEQLSG
jgi:sugar phosphate isomerase/epimerase